MNRHYLPSEIVGNLASFHDVLFRTRRILRRWLRDAVAAVRCPGRRSSAWMVATKYRRIE